MIGWQRIEKGKSPEYVLGRVADGYQPPERAELSEMPEDPKDKDVWTSASWLPFWHPTSFELRIFHAANDGSRDAVANVVEGYVNNCVIHPDQINFDPVIELNVDSYENKHGRQIFYPIFDTERWIERPAAVRRIVPPPVKMLLLTAAAAPQIEASASAPPVDAVEASTTAPQVPPKQKLKTKSATKSYRDDMDDEVPF
jgi:hypothetical protein